MVREGLEEEGGGQKHSDWNGNENEGGQVPHDLDGTSDMKLDGAMF